MPRERDKDAMDGLTDEERAAIEEADAEENPGLDAKDAEIDEVVEQVSRERDPETGRFIAKDEGNEFGDAPAKEAEKEVAADNPPEAKAEEAAEDAGETEDEPEEKEPVKFRPAPKAAAVEDGDAKLEELSTKRDELAEQFDNGDITAKEFSKGLADIDRDVRAIERAQDRAQMAEDLRKDTWLNQTVPGFMAEHAAYASNPVLHNMLDAQVRHLQVAAMENGQDPLDPSILETAHKAIVASMQSLTGAAPAKPEAKPEPKKAAPAPSKRPAAPPTLANVPASEINETESEFAVLDRLSDSDPEAFEAAMAKLPEAQRERYLASQ